MSGMMQFKDYYTHMIVFHDMSTFVGYLMPNSVCIYIYIYIYMNHHPDYGRL